MLPGEWRLGSLESMMMVIPTVSRVGSVPDAGLRFSSLSTLALVGLSISTGSGRESLAIVTTPGGRGRKRMRINKHAKFHEVSLLFPLWCLEDGTRCTMPQGDKIHVVQREVKIHGHQSKTRPEENIPGEVIEAKQGTAFLQSDTGTNAYPDTKIVKVTLPIEKAIALLQQVQEDSDSK